MIEIASVASFPLLIWICMFWLVPDSVLVVEQADPNTCTQALSMFCWTVCPGRMEPVAKKRMQAIANLCDFTFESPRSEHFHPKCDARGMPDCNLQFPRQGTQPEFPSWPAP